MQKRTFNTRLLEASCYQECMSSSDPFIVFAAFVGGMTTDELRMQYCRMQFHPNFLVACVQVFRQRLSAAVEHADFRRSCARLPRHLEGIPNVEIERQWLAIADELVERAEAAFELWYLAGGERALEERINESAADEDPPAAPTAASPVIELNPVFNIEVTQAGDGRPLDVRVVALPARETTTEIERDGNGEIVGSRQVERDAA